MPENNNVKQYLDYEGAKYIIEELQKKIAKKASKKDLENIEVPVATKSKVGGIMVGDGLSINENGILSADVQEAITSWSELLNKPQTLAELGVEGIARQEDLELLAEKLATVYTPKGSVNTVADLDNVEKQPGWVYNVVENGKNYAWTGTEWDDLGGIIDLSDYMRLDDIRPLTTIELDTIMNSASSVESLAAIIGQNKSKIELEISDDIVISSPISVPVGKNVTIDLNGQVITAGAAAFVADGGTITIAGEGEINATGIIAQATNGGTVIVNGGTFEANGNQGFASVGANSKIIFNDGDLTTQEGGLMAFDGGSVTLNGGVLTARDNFVLATNGTRGRGGNTIVMNGGTLVGKIQSNGYCACGVYVANEDEFIMNGGEILATNGAGLVMRGGHVVINDGKIVATGIAGTTGYVGDSKNPVSKSAIVFDEKANYPAVASMNLEVHGGTLIGVDHAIHIMSDAAQPNVTVDGGSFAPAYPEE